MAFYLYLFYSFICRYRYKFTQCQIYSYNKIYKKYFVIVYIVFLEKIVREKLIKETRRAVKVSERDKYFDQNEYVSVEFERIS